MYKTFVKNNIMFKKRNVVEDNIENCDAVNTLSVNAVGVAAIPNGNNYNFFLDDVVGAQKNYREWVNILSSASPNDSITLHINSPGGDLYTALVLYDYFLQTQAEVHISLEGEVNSAASMIACMPNFTSLSVSPFCSMMIHDYSTGEWGHFNQFRDRQEFNNKWFPNIVETIYHNFLDEDEIKAVLNGKEIWLTASEIRERFDNRQELINAEMKEAEEEKEAQMIEDMKNHIAEYEAKKKEEKKTSSKKKLV